MRYPKGKPTHIPPVIPRLPSKPLENESKQSASRYRSKSDAQSAVPTPPPKEEASRARHAPSSSTSRAQEEALAILTSRERRIGRHFEIPEVPIRSREFSGNGLVIQQDHSLDVPGNSTSTHPLRQHAPHAKERTNLTNFESRVAVGAVPPQQQPAERRSPERKAKSPTVKGLPQSESKKRARRGSIGQAPQLGPKQETSRNEGQQVNQPVNRAVRDSSTQKLQSSEGGRYKNVFSTETGLSNAPLLSVTTAKEKEDKVSPASGILSGGGGIVPGIDAPASAINSGERKAKVKCGHSSLILLVTVSTTCADILHSAAKVLPQKVDVNNSVLLESYKDLGLERPIRRYEHIRDVLNSWDHDDDNTLLIVPSANGDIDEDLDIKGVPAQQPGDTTFQLYHSQRPGIWDKRTITLRADGQVLMVKGIGREMKNICHMSDFDIYIPTAKHTSKFIKPPKRHCFAMKSQYKSSIFLSTENFVHFFCTKDQNVAAAWYKAAQGWRTWHLVNVMGKGHEDKAPEMKTTVDMRRSLETSGHRPDKPSITSPYLTGSFKPLISEDEYEQINGSPQAPSPPKHYVNTAAMHAQQKMNRPKRAPPISFPRGFREEDDVKTLQYNALAAQTPVLPNPLPDDVPLGLLAKTHSAQPRLGSPIKENVINTYGHDDTNTSRGHGRALSVRSTRTSGGGLGRTATQRQPQPQKPLIDLTPEYKEPPQHIKKGRGIIPQQMPAGGLVEIATTPEVAIPVPPAVAWQRPSTSSGRPGTSNGESSYAQQSRRQRSGTMHDLLPQRQVNG